MTWETKITLRPRYEYISTNQHGDRYKKAGNERVKVARLTASVNNAHDLKTLILISDHVNARVRYDFDKPQTAFIEIVSGENIGG